MDDGNEETQLQFHDMGLDDRLLKVAYNIYIHIYIFIYYKHEINY